MAKLIMSLDGSVIREIVLDKDRVTIGRKPTNDVQIDNLAVSGDHARIVTNANDWVLEDLDSTNGTLVNGAPVKKHLLQNNDLIGLGKYKLKFITEGPARQPVAPVADDMEKTMMLRPGSGATRPAPRPAPAVRPVTAAPAPAGMLQKLKSWLKSWLE